MKSYIDYNTKDLIEFIPLGILSTIGFVSIIIVLTTNSFFTYHQYIGLPILSFCFMLFFIHRSAYRYLMAIVLLISTLNVFGFCVFQFVFQFSFQFGSLPTLQFDCLLVLLIFIYINRKRLTILIQKFTKPSLEENQNQQNTFKHNFRNLSQAQLEEKLKDDSIVEDAKKAALELIKEKKTILK